MLRVADWGMHVFHLAFILFSAFGWAHTSTIELHLIAQLMVIVSWFGLGYFTYPGFCLLTSIHWKIRSKRGIYYESNSYIYWLFDQVLSKPLHERTTNIGTMVIFFLTLIISVFRYIS